MQAGIPLLDAVGPAIMDQIREGDLIELHDGALWRDGEKLAVGELLVADEIELRMEDARRTIGVELQKFARNTLQYIDSEALITFEPLELPPLRAKIRGRHVLVVVRGHDYEHDLKALRPYVREYQPVLIAVDGGADALLAMKLKPDVIIGDFDSLSPAAMHCGAQLIHHVHPDGRAPGRENLVAAGVDYDEFVAEGMSEDAALLIAYEAGATLIVAVGARDDGRVPRQGSARHGVDLPDATAARPGARGRQGCEPAVRGPHPAARHGVPRRVGRGRDGRDGLRLALAARVLRRLPVGVQRRLVTRHELVLSAALSPVPVLLGSPCPP